MHLECVFIVFRKGKVYKHEEKIIKEADRSYGTCCDDGSPDSSDGSRDITGSHDTGDDVRAADIRK